MGLIIYILECRNHFIILFKSKIRNRGLELEYPSRDLRKADSTELSILDTGAGAKAPCADLLVIENSKMMN